METLIIPVATGSFVREYVNIMRNIHGTEMSNKDILNQTIVSIPTIFGNVDVCGWSLSHVATHYYVSKAVDRYITKNKIVGAGLCFTCGVIWYVYEDSISDDSYTSNGSQIAYPNITKPQPSDFLFNITGQVLFIVENALST